MKIKMRLFKEKFYQLMEFDKGNEPDNDKLHDYLHLCWEYHNCEEKEQVNDSQQRVMIIEFLLFHFKEFDSNHVMRLKPYYKKIANK